MRTLLQKQQNSRFAVIQQKTIRNSTAVILAVEKKIPAVTIVRKDNITIKAVINVITTVREVITEAITTIIARADIIVREVITEAATTIVKAVITTTEQAVHTSREDLKITDLITDARITEILHRSSY